MERNRAVLLHKISKAGFVMGELVLYLDTHPADIHALRHFEFYRNKHDELTREYERRYGPLTAEAASGSETGRWNWIDGPWPWEREYNNEEIK